MFSRFFIDRPIFAAVLAIVTVIAGTIAVVALLPTSLYPEVVPPVVQVTASYPGANAQVVADTVAAQIEQQVNGVERMLYMSSQCTNDGNMTLDITFELGTNVDIAQVLVQNRVAIAEPRLPEAVKAQGVTTKKKSPAILLVVNLFSPEGRYDQLYLSNYMTVQIKDSIARLKGVGDVKISGARDYSMRLWLDPTKLATRNMDASDVVRAIREQNVQVAAGRIGAPPVAAGTDFQYAVNTLGRLISQEQFEEIIVKTNADGTVVRLRDVGRAELGAQNYDVDSNLDGKPATSLLVYQLPGANSIDIANRVYAEMKLLKQRFPEGIEYGIYYDTTDFVRKSLESVVHTLLEAFVLVFIVVLVFLQSWRATIIPLLAVPVSLVGTFAVMHLLGFSLNNLSMFGLVLAIGVVVDDAIVVVENVERWIEHGLSPREASYKSMEEVTVAVIAVAFGLSAVFIPVAFISGISGQFYRQFALTIAVSTLISAFNSLTLSPALTAILLKPKTAKRDPLTWLLDSTLGWFFRGFNRVFNWTTDVYGHLVTWCIRGAVVSLAVYAGLIGLTWLDLQRTPIGFIPQQDQGYLFLNAQLPDSASLERTSAVCDTLTKIALKTPGVAHTVGLPGYSMVNGINLANVASVILVLAPFHDRENDPAQGADAIIASLQRETRGIQEALVGVFNAPPIQGLGTTGGYKLEVQDRGSTGLANLEGATLNMIDTARGQPGVVAAMTSFRANTPQLYVDVDRTKVKNMNVALNDVFDTLQIYLGSAYINDITFLGRNWQVYAQADTQFRRRPEDIAKLKVRNFKGDMVPLGTMITVKEIGGPAVYNRYNMFPAAEINLVATSEVSSGQVIDMADEIAKKDLPASMAYQWTDLTFQQILAGNTAIYIFPLCVLFVFLTHAAEYESWTLPLAIILIVPLSVLFALIGINLRGMDNNIFAQIGFVVLIGLAAKNAVLIVEFAKQQREHHGANRRDAAINAAKLRLRPILMTSFAFILGVVPLVIAKGAGHEMRQQLGTAVFSGMLGVTLCGIFLTPVFYVVLQAVSDAFGGSHPSQPPHPREPIKDEALTVAAD
ncbi:MAG TPA: multidrug efflux RND transporter permease subunit [Pirellulales bacterium]|nr:multidrug efflux RND transporter permease subunit [Pirellulales bacterium]